MILDALGNLLASTFRAPAVGFKTVPAVNGCYIYANSINIGKYNRSLIRQTQVGKGTTLPQRNDLGIEDPFTVAIENSLVNAGDMSYTSGLGKMESSTLLSPTGGSGVVTEVYRQFRVWFPAGGGSFVSKAGLRDVIAGVPFVNGESIFVNNEAFI